MYLVPQNWVTQVVWCSWDPNKEYQHLTDLLRRRWFTLNTPTKIQKTGTFVDPKMSSMATFWDVRKATRLKCQIPYRQCFVMFGRRYCSSALACSVKTARNMPTSWRGAAAHCYGIDGSCSSTILLFIPVVIFHSHLKLPEGNGWLVGGDWLPSILFSHSSWESHHPNWRTHSNLFPEGWPWQPPTRL